jgi:hypothetical protein
MLKVSCSSRIVLCVRFFVLWKLQSLVKWRHHIVSGDQQNEQIVKVKDFHTV